MQPGPDHLSHTDSFFLFIHPFFDVEEYSWISVIEREKKRNFCSRQKIMVQTTRVGVNRSTKYIQSLIVREIPPLILVNQTRVPNQSFSLLWARRDSTCKGNRKSMTNMNRHLIGGEEKLTKLVHPSFQVWSQVLLHHPNQVGYRRRSVYGIWE